MLTLLARLALAVFAFVPGPEDFAAKGPLAVKELVATWHDAARNVDVPVKIYRPEELPGAWAKDAAKEGKYPLIVFSHGMGGSRETYAYIGRHLASHGYVVVHPTHKGSDTEAIRDEIKDRVVGGKDRRAAGLIEENTGDPKNLENRPKDITFVIDQVGKDADLTLFADMTRIGVGGHSFGAYTAMVEAGMTVDLPSGKDVAMRDDRVKATIAMSPEGHGIMGIHDGSWAHLKAPILFLTGTKDYGQGNRSAAWRREAFDAAGGVDAYFALIKDAGHMMFAGGRIGSNEKDQKLVLAETTAFFDAYVKGDAKAKEWLRGEGMKSLSKGDCTVEIKKGEDAAAEKKK